MEGCNHAEIQDGLETNMKALGYSLNDKEIGENRIKISFKGDGVKVNCKIKDRTNDPKKPGEYWINIIIGTRDQITETSFSLFGPVTCESLIKSVLSKIEETLQLEDDVGITLAPVHHRNRTHWILNPTRPMHRRTKLADK